MSIVIISTPEHARALRKRLDDPAVVVFADTDSLQALDAIQTTRPKIVALNSMFVETARGAGLVAQLKGDARSSGIDLRVLLEDENKAPILLADQTASSEMALLEASRPLGRAGTRAALRYVMDRRGILVNGEPSHLIDLSITGAQVLLPTRVRPNEPVRLVLSSEAGETRFPGTVVWSVAVPTRGSIQYRAGVKLSKPDTKWIEDYCHQFGGRPDLTFGAE
ncbi:MAG TPA: PilZ domain-containing protein [Vicinamibacterales bacterium]